MLQKKNGFSLIEVTLIIITVGFIVVLILNLPRSLNLIGRSHLTSVADVVAAQKIADFRSQGYASLASPSGAVAFSDTRLAGFPGKVSTYEIKNCPSAVCKNNEATKEIDVKISWVEQSQTRQVLLYTLISLGGLK